MVNNVLFVLALLLAAADVYLTHRLVWNIGKREGNPVIRLLYRKMGTYSWVVHSLLWAGLIATPRIFNLDGESIGYAIIIAVLAYALVNNYKILRKNA